VARVQDYLSFFPFHKIQNLTVSIDKHGHGRREEWCIRNEKHKDREMEKERNRIRAPERKREKQ
jgi:hypothetical protein